MNSTIVNSVIAYNDDIIRERIKSRQELGLSRISEKRLKVAILLFDRHSRSKWSKIFTVALLPLTLCNILIKVLLSIVVWILEGIFSEVVANILALPFVPLKAISEGIDYIVNLFWPNEKRSKAHIFYNVIGMYINPNYHQFH